MDTNSGASTGAAFDSTNLNQYSTPDLIRFLRTSFRASEYEEVTRIIASREQDTNAAVSRLRIEKIGVESSLAAKAAGIERIREQLERAEEELAIVREEEKQAREEAKEWLRKYCKVQTFVLKGLDDNIDLKEKIEVLEKEKETGAWCCRARCNGVKLEGRLGNGGTAMENGGAGIIGAIEISDEEDDMVVDIGLDMSRFEFRAYTDANWDSDRPRGSLPHVFASFLETRWSLGVRSMTKFYYLAPNTKTWYHTLSSTTKENVHIRRLLEDMNILV